MSTTILLCHAGTGVQLSLVRSLAFDGRSGGISGVDDQAPRVPEAYR